MFTARVLRVVLLFAGLISGLSLTGCEGPEIDLDETPMDVLSETTGYGSIAENGMLVTVDYHVFFPDSGETLLRDSSFSFLLGQGAVIRGIDEAVVGMRTARSRRTRRCTCASS